MDIRVESHAFDLLVVIHIWPTHGWATGRVEWRAILIYSYFLVSDKLGLVLKMIGLRPDQSFCIEASRIEFLPYFVKCPFFAHAGHYSLSGRLLELAR